MAAQELEWEIVAALELGWELIVAEGVTTGKSCVPMTRTIVYLRSPSWTCIAPSCNHVACHFGLFPTFRLYSDSLAQPCTV